MPIFKLTDPGAEVTYTLWHFDVDAFLEQYDEASLCPHIFASLHKYPGKWACTLDEGKDISMQDLLMHMEKTFSNKHNYDAMIRTLYEVQQKEDETVEEYMLHIHDAVSLYAFSHGTDGTAAFLLEEHGGLHPGECGESTIRRCHGGPQEVDVDELVTVRERLPGSVSDRDHRGMGQTPLRGYGPCDDHTTEGGGRPATGGQATSSGTPCSPRVHMSQEWKWQSFAHG